MIVSRYKPVTQEGRDDSDPDGGFRRGYLFERPLPPDSLLRMTEDFSPVYEMAFRPGITDEQARATLRTIERVHRAKSIEMSAWTEAMRRAEAEKHRALKRIQDDMEVDQLRAQLKVMKGRLEEKSREISDSSHFLQQVAALRSNYEKERGKQQETLLESPPRRNGGGTSGRGTGGVEEDAAMFSSSRMSTGKKQKLYNALHYSALYDEAASIGGTSPTRTSTSPTRGRGGVVDDSVRVSTASSVTSPSHVHAALLQQTGGSSTPTPLKVHERFFHQRPAPSLSYSPAKMQLNPLKSVPVTAQGQSTVPLVVDAATLVDRPPENDEGAGKSSSTPFGLPRKKV